MITKKICFGIDIFKITLMLATIMILLAGCGSTKMTKFSLGAFKYESEELIENRVYIVNGSVVGIDVTIDESTGTPRGRGGLVTYGKVVDTTGNKFPRTITMEKRYKVPCLFDVFLKTTIKPTNLEVKE